MVCHKDFSLDMVKCQKKITNFFQLCNMFLKFITNINGFPVSFYSMLKKQPTYLQRVAFWSSFSFFTSCMDYAVFAIDLINKSWTEVTKFCSSQQYLSAYSMGLHQF